MRGMALTIVMFVTATVQADEFYLLQQVDKTPRRWQLDHPKVDGYSIRVRWRTLEPADQDFEWAYLDRQVSNAQARRKPYMLRILAGTSSPQHSFSVSQNGIPTPWHAFHQREFERLITAVSRRYASDPDLIQVHVPGFWKSAEMHLPNGNWPRQQMLNAWLHRVDTVAAAFPNQRICINHSPQAFSADVVNQSANSLGDRFVVQMNALKASTNVNWVGYTSIVSWGQSGVTTGWQFVSPSTNSTRFGGTFMEAVNKGRRSSPSYFETYAPDLNRIPND